MLQKIDPKTLTVNPFTLIGDQWMLITAGTPEHCNTMTASWGGVGVMWAEPSATCYIRPQRYTKEFVDNSDYFTLCFFDESYRKALNLCGSTSGRDVDKIKECGFTVQGQATPPISPRQNWCWCAKSGTPSSCSRSASPTRPLTGSFIPRRTIM